MRLIDANALMKRPPDMNDTYDESGDYDYAHGYTINAIKTAPTVDAVPVVRCKDCRYSSKGVLGGMHCRMYDRLHSADWYCADGERKGVDE